MKHEMNLFYGLYNKGGYPDDYRWDIDKNASLLNIVYIGGTFGNFLKYFIERYSTKTPPMETDPFNATGTAHQLYNKQFSGLVQKYHQSFINDNKGETDLPICLITPTHKKQFLYLQKAQWFRQGDSKNSPDDLWKKAVGEMPEQVKRHAIEIIKQYDIKETAHFTWIPKFIVRDWYKQGFLQDLKSTHHYQWFDMFKNHPFFQKQKVFHFDLGAFFDWNTFKENIVELDKVYGLALDFGREGGMQKLFHQGYSLDVIRQESNLADDVLEKGLDTSLSNLDVSTEAYIYAEVEKKNDFIQMPLTNRFFRDTGELNQFVEHYPIHYKAMNPNMPEFNGIPNPYYLNKSK